MCLTKLGHRWAMVVITKECGITIEYSVYIERLSLRQVRRNRR